MEELQGAIELRSLLSGNETSRTFRAELAERFGRAIAELHAAGFETPDLTAKHTFVDPVSFDIALLDWQSARRSNPVGLVSRLRSLAALHASLADCLVGPRERARFLWAYRRVAIPSNLPCPRFATFAREVERLAIRARGRRSIRDQREVGIAPTEQRLVWLAGEAVCAVPDVAEGWPVPAIAAPFYVKAALRRENPVQLSLWNGREALLIRGSSRAPIAHLIARLRCRIYRSPGVVVGRVLFHLQRYGLPAPKLLAFGQRAGGQYSFDWFALYEQPAGVPLADWLNQRPPAAIRWQVFDRMGSLLRQLHDAGCRWTRVWPSFWVSARPPIGVSIGNPLSVCVVRHLTDQARRRDLFRIVMQITSSRTDRLRMVRGYFGSHWSRSCAARSAARFVIARGTRGGRW